MLSSLIKLSLTLIHMLELMFLTLLLWLISWLPGVKAKSWYIRLFRFWCRIFVNALGVELRLHQKNIRPVPERYILIANHPSAFEDIGIPALFKVRCLAKSEVKHWPIVGRISAAAGTLFVNRKCSDSRREAVKRMVEVLNTGDNIGLYPEGGCFDKRLHTLFRYGAFEVSLKTGIPILPVFLHYESQNDFAWPDGVSLPRKLWDFITTQNNRANYYLYDALDPNQFQDCQDYCQSVYNRYLEWQQRYLD